MEKLDLQQQLAQAKEEVAYYKPNYWASQKVVSDHWRNIQKLEEERDALQQQLTALAADLARRNAQEPIYQLMDDGKWYDTEKYLYDEAKERGDVARLVYAGARQAVLPNLKKWQDVEGELTDFGKAVFAGGYNQAIADATALGCQPQVVPDYFAVLVASAVEAAQKAMVKFPQPNYVLLKVAEEAGEVVQAGVHYAEGRETWAALEGEVVQTLAMLYRLVTEGDHVNGVIPPKASAAGEAK